MPFVTHQPVESQARGRRDEPCQIDGGLGRGDSGPLHAEVDVDEHADRDPLRDRRPAQRGDVVGMVDGHLDVGLVLEGREPGGLARADDQVGDQDVVDPRGGHDLGLGDLGHRDPDGARPPQDVGDRRALERLGMGTPGHAAVPEVAGHPIDIVLQEVQVDQEGGGIQLGHRQTDRAELHRTFLARMRAGKVEAKTISRKAQGSQRGRGSSRGDERTNASVRDFRWHSGGGDANVNGADGPESEGD